VEPKKVIILQYKDSGGVISFNNYWNLYILVFNWFYKNCYIYDCVDSLDM